GECGWGEGGGRVQKWLLAPHGTGFLYVRREKIGGTWPLQAAADRQNDDIRKFEQIGTAQMAPKAAIAEALAFHKAIGGDRKAARLRYLTLRWANELKQQPRVEIYSSLHPGQTWGPAYGGIDGIEAAKIASHLWDKYRIIVASMTRGPYPAQQFDFQGIRVTPNIYTTLDEIDTFVGAIKTLLRT